MSGWSTEEYLARLVESAPERVVAILDHDVSNRLNTMLIAAMLIKDISSEPKPDLEQIRQLAETIETKGQDINSMVSAFVQFNQTQHSVEKKE